jgi:hypothetical protein
MSNLETSCFAAETPAANLTNLQADRNGLPPRGRNSSLAAQACCLGNIEPVDVCGIDYAGWG